MERGPVVCEACGAAVPLRHARRLLWARVCPRCESRLSGVAPRVARSAATPADPDVAVPVRSAAGGAGARPGWRSLATPLLYAALLCAASLAGPAALAAASGALGADLLAWFLVQLVRVPAGGKALLVDVALRLAALIVWQGPGLPVLGGAEQAHLGAAAGGFFAVLVLRALWFALWWNDLVGDGGSGASHDAGDDGDAQDEAPLERFFPARRAR